VKSSICSLVRYREAKTLIDEGMQKHLLLQHSGNRILTDFIGEGYLAVRNHTAIRACWRLKRILHDVEKVDRWDETFERPIGTIWIGE
jgi:hypothetical protein